MEDNEVSAEDFLWCVDSVCALHGKPSSRELNGQQFPPPRRYKTILAAAEAAGLDASKTKCKLSRLRHENAPVIVWIDGIREDAPDAPDAPGKAPVLVLRADEARVLVLRRGAAQPETLPLEALQSAEGAPLLRFLPKVAEARDADAIAAGPSRLAFGFKWILGEFGKHKRIWYEILLGSLVLQLLALAMPLFTQTVIDKVVVHRTESTLIVIVIGMALFMLFSAVISWLRQYLILHTGNRIDGTLGFNVFEHLFRLPPRYFERRQTGVIAARLGGIETIREFVSSASVSLILDLPFLLIFVAIMAYYSVALTAVALAMLGIIVGLSLFVAPMFQRKLQRQFQLGARNQAYVTEYVVGLETVKSLQLESQIKSTYSGYLATYLQSSFDTKQLANTYNTIANAAEQAMTLLILGIGAYIVIHSQDFTIGMLVAFQMFSGKLSQPLLRLVGLWHQFQQARISIARLGDIMNAPAEQYSTVPGRPGRGEGTIQLEQLAFRYTDNGPLLYEDLNLKVEAGQAIAIVGPSGCGKSTLAKLLQRFYVPSAGRILVDGIDLQHLSANELRSRYGVVPQETTLFSGTIFDNLQMANPNATLQDIVTACRMAEIHTTIEAMPDGYQSEIGERGAGLSGGQKQRLAIARALLRKPSILIFDEATSALDSQTAEQFARTIDALRGKVTILFITHAIPRSLRFDAIYKLGRNGVQSFSPVPAKGPVPPMRPVERGHVPPLVNQDQGAAA